MDIIDLAVQYFSVAYLVVSVIWGVIIYILLLVGISKWAERWERNPTNWVLVGLFFSPGTAAALLLMYGSNVDKTKLIDKKLEEYKTYWRSQMNDLITVIKNRLPLTVESSPQLLSSEEEAAIEKATLEVEAREDPDEFNL